MAVTYTGAEIPTDFKAEIIAEILFRNETVEKNLVAFETGIKAGRIITENINSVTMQAWTVNPTGSEAGAIGLEDTVVTPHVSIVIWHQVQSMTYLMNLTD